jgi:hypothetical protein
MSHYPPKLYLDTETCGLHSMMVLLQYAIEDGPIVLHEVWRRPIRETLALIEMICQHTVVGFNLAFDWFHICKIYTVFRLCDPDWIPEEHLDEIAMLEPQGQDGPCVKPAASLDLMLHSRKGPFQSLMARDDIRIKRVPTALAYALSEELEGRVHLDDIYFARSADPDAPRWQAFDRKDKWGDIDTDFKDVVLRFNPAGGLKFLAEHALGYKPKFHFKDVEPPTSWRPYELGYAPTALAVSSPEENWEVWGVKKGKPKLAEQPTSDVGADLADEHDDDAYTPKTDPNCKLLGIAWPGVIRKHIEHWATRADAREYANDDIVYTRALDKHFTCPEPNDDDSVLACMVPAVRWHGFKINRPGVEELLQKAQEVVAESPVNINKPGEVRAFVTAAMDDVESVILEESTKKSNLEAILDWEIAADEPCSKCQGNDPNCARCGGTGVLKPGKHPAALRSKMVLNVKFAAKEVELYNKLLMAGKFHASFVVIGALSSRMSGADGLNPQGIKHTKEVRRMFPLAWETMVLCGGDFDSFEVTLADAVYNDPALRRELLSKVPCHKCSATGRKPCKKCAKAYKKCHPDCPECGQGQLGDCDECEGTGQTRKKIHALFGTALSGLSYDEVMASAGTDNDWYDKGKRGVFAMIYGGDWNTLVQKLGVTAERAKAAYDKFCADYPGVFKARQKTFNAFCSMKQPAGIGSAVVWEDPVDYAITFLGFKRYFTLENTICKALFDLARNIPKHWKQCKVKVVRRDRVQTAGGAVASALYGAAFQMQAANMRAAANHEIQSPGAQITKRVQRRIWDLQPAGIHPLQIAILNVHDELMTVAAPSVVTSITQAVRDTVESFRPQVPLIGMTWYEEMENWAEKKGGAAPVRIRSKEMEMAVGVAA